MLGHIEKLRTRISDLVRAELFALENPEAALNSRDTADFENEWLRVHNALSKLEQGQLLSESTRQLIHDIERVAFKTVYAVTGAKGFTEFAPAVSEDFGLFARALCFDYQDAWLNGLLVSYQRSVFPCGRIQPSEIGLEELVLHDAPL